MKLCLIDGYNFVFRAFHSLPALSTKDGTPIGAVYGFLNILYNLISRHEADMIAVALDTGEKTFRHKIYEDYKSNRPEPAEELKIQFPIIREVINALNIKSIEKIGFEADDLIAAYTKKALESGHEVKIIGSDKDLIQLMGEKVTIFDPIKQRNIDNDYVFKKHGVNSIQMIDYLSMVGDSADHIPGVKGIGAKTAAKLLNEHGTLDAIYNNLENIDSKRIKNLLIEGKDNSLLSKNLIILNTELELPLALEELKYQELDKKLFRNFLEQYGFKSLLRKVSDSEEDVKKINFTTKEISNKEELSSLLPKVKESGLLCIYYDNKNLSIFFEENLYKINITQQLQLLEVESQNNNNNSLESFYKIFQEIWEEEGILKICIDAKAIYKDLSKLGIRFCTFDDIALISYTLDTGKHSYDINTLINIYGHNSLKPDAHSIHFIYQILRLKMFHEKKFTLYETIEKPLITILAEMELKGIKVDKTILSNLSEEFSEKLDILENEIYKDADYKFNIGSPKQIGEVLFEKLGISGGKKSKKSGTYVTSHEVLEQLSEQGYKITEKILEWRHYSKLINTYTEALQRAVNHKTGRVHTTFSMTATSTGRLSSHNPNLQNIPIKTTEGNKIRNAFIAAEDHLIVCADYSQIELRILADMANIEPLQKAFMQNQDIHSITASQIFNIPLEKIDNSLRRKAKAINFGIIYGISPYGLARNVGISKEEAKLYINNYFTQYPGIKEYMDKTIHFAKVHGYVETMKKRKCFIKGINDKSYALRNFAERAAINAPIQGTASDIIKCAMVNLPKQLSQYLILQIHDELLFEIPTKKVETYSTKIKSIMEKAANLNIPIKVEIKSSTSWGSAKD